MSLGSVAERFLFVFNSPFPPTYHPPPLPAPPIPSVVFRNRFSSDTLQEYLRDLVWDKGRKHYVGLQGNTSPGFSNGRKLEFLVLNS